MPIFKMLMIILLFGYKSRKKQQFLHEIAGQGLIVIWKQAVFRIKKLLEIETPIDLFHWYSGQAQLSFLRNYRKEPLTQYLQVVRKLFACC